MDVAGLAVVLANAQIRQQASVQVASKIMDVAEVRGADLVRMMEQSVTPNVGNSIDIKL